MQEGGTPLAMIAAALGVEQSSPPTRVHDAARASARAGRVTSEAPSLWMHIALSDDVLLQVRGRVLSEQQRRALIDAVRPILKLKAEEDRTATELP